MRIILTHEQADFDAIASMLAAFILDDEALPVLPRRMNRNVRGFLTLYGIELPFVDPRDLPAEVVNSVTLVDTQSLVTVKGMNAQTRVHLIDHHPQKDHLPAEWSSDIEDVGATTTILVESIRDRDIPLTPLQATLLLLGIYEDTGSLTYTRTSGRDLRSAAFLLDQDANLQIAGDFLNHPLSPTQQALYDHLRKSAEYLHIHGHVVIVTHGEAQEVDEELSSVAHKLRDLLDPDALFLLVKTRGGVQLIARSTSELIDVSAITANFGGGGHERAAAGLIRDRDLESIRTELVQILPQLIQPAVTVAQIMSRDPQLLFTNTPLEEAAARMSRYGYEGYPVVEAEASKTHKDNKHADKVKAKVVGLLTRRAVDKAIAHKLNKTVGSLMEGGSFSVHPDDSIEQLQHIMTGSGWGQIPVIDPQDGAIIGIVTRTDLLKTLSPQSQLPSRFNLVSRLESLLPPEQLILLKVIAQAAHANHYPLYIVGGFVRDLWLDRPSLDFDLVVEGDAIHLAYALAKKFGGRVTSHARFGTAKWLIDPLSFAKQSENFTGLRLTELPASLDLVSARMEFYAHPSALPTVERGSIKLDLHRRDFTINTLALRLDGHHYGELHDYWGGLNDLRHGLVRVLHSLSFVDDPTRMLRAVRFEQRFHFRIEERTIQLMEEAYSLLERVSGDRIRHELNHIIDEEKSVHILERLHLIGLLEIIHPNLTWDAWIHSRIASLPDKEPDPDWGLTYHTGQNKARQSLAYVLWLLRLPHKSAESVCARLKFSTTLVETVLAACRLWTDLPSMVDLTPSALSSRLDDVPAQARYAVYLATTDPQLRNLLQSYATRWQRLQPCTTGSDLRKMGLPPGPLYKEILSTLRNGWIDGDIQSEASEKIVLQGLIEKLKPS